MTFFIFQNIYFLTIFNKKYSKISVQIIYVHKFVIWKTYSIEKKDKIDVKKWWKFIQFGFF